jgi:hypothetical protein
VLVKIGPHSPLGVLSDDVRAEAPRLGREMASDGLYDVLNKNRLGATNPCDLFD